MDEPCPYQCNYKIGPSSMVLYNNALHFVTSLKNIIGFELGSEKFYEVPLPSDPLVVRYQPIELASLRGCLHLVRLTEIWIMKEYGVQESWTKLFRFSDANENGLFDRKILGQRRIMPYAYSEDGREILVALDIRDNKILHLDLQSREFKKLEISGLPKDWTYWARFGYAMPWVGSFVHPS
ncbi:F-box protein CPR30-like [Chenopodium quinoa]|uniref:F-box protein CPR30-like n=1 Tax=Chenopodium quinoa TaxID=63459 RepID=UPI000B76DD30|nr:F-box protein CPR30-like [Chenopodium quinoa]